MDRASLSQIASRSTKASHCGRKFAQRAQGEVSLIYGRPTSARARAESPPPPTPLERVLLDEHQRFRNCCRPRSSLILTGHSTEEPVPLVRLVSFAWTHRKIGATLEQVGTAPAAQGIEHRFPNPKIRVGLDGKPWKFKYFAGFVSVAEQACRRKVEQDWSKSKSRLLLHGC